MKKQLQVEKKKKLYTLSNFSITNHSNHDSESKYVKQDEEMGL